MLGCLRPCRSPSTHHARCLSVGRAVLLSAKPARIYYRVGFNRSTTGKHTWWGGKTQNTTLAFVSLKRASWPVVRFASYPLNHSLTCRHSLPLVLRRSGADQRPVFQPPRVGAHADRGRVGGGEVELAPGDGRPVDDGYVCTVDDSSPVVVR